MPIVANPEEIAGWRYVDLEELDRDIKTRPEMYTPWFKMEWQGIRDNHMKAVESLIRT